MILKKLTNEYIDSYKDLINKSFSILSSKKSLEKMVKDKQYNTIVMIDKDQVVGSITYEERYDYIKNCKFYYLSYVCTDINYQRQNIASKILEYIESTAKLENVEYITFTSSSKRKKAHAFYFKHQYLLRDTNVFIKYINE